MVSSRVMFTYENQTQPPAICLAPEVRNDFCGVQYNVAYHTDSLFFYLTSCDNTYSSYMGQCKHYDTVPYRCWLQWLYQWLSAPVKCLHWGENLFARHLVCPWFRVRISSTKWPTMMLLHVVNGLDEGSFLCRSPLGGSWVVVFFFSQSMWKFESKECCYDAV